LSRWPLNGWIEIKDPDDLALQVFGTIRFDILVDQQELSYTYYYIVYTFTRLLLNSLYIGRIKKPAVGNNFKIYSQSILKYGKILKLLLIKNNKIIKY